MSSSDDYDPVLRERQEEELEVIKAIYFDGVEDLEENPSGPLKIALRLGPQRGASYGGLNTELQRTMTNSPTTSIRLILTMQFQYPNQIPHLSIDQVKGLNEQEVKELQAELVKVAQDSIGEVMIHNISQSAETFLYNHRKRPTVSFYDEMMNQKKLQDESNVKRTLEVQERQNSVLQIEVLRRQEALKEEIAARNKDSPSSQDSYSSTSPAGDNRAGDIGRHSHRRSSSLKRFSESDSSPSSFDSEVTAIEFSFGKKASTLVHRGRILGEPSLRREGSRVYAGLDSQTGTLVAILEWKFNLRVDKRTAKLKGTDHSEGQSVEAVMKQLTSLETEFKVLPKLEHPNIGLYYGMTVRREDGGSQYITDIAQEFICGTSLKTYLQDNLSLDIAITRHYALGLLNGLEYLHSNNIVHRFLRDTSVFIDSAGIVKMIDYGLERKLHELLQLTTGKEVLQDRFAPSIGRGAKKCDIYRFGILMLSLVTGQYVSTNPPKIPSSLPVELQDLLKKCTTPVESERWTALQLLEHPFIKLPLQKRLNLFSCSKEIVEEKQECLTKESEIDNADIQSFLSGIVKGHSRLKEEFEIIEFLGKGGFGDVLKAKNKLDGRVYALKRIRLNPRNKQLNKKITREVKYLSQFNHENVVRYFTSWIEYVLDAEPESDSNTTSNATPTTKPSHSPMENNNQNHATKADQHLNLMVNSIGLVDNIEDLAVPFSNRPSDWSLSHSHLSEDESSEEDDDEDDCMFASPVIRKNSDTESIVFGNESPNKGSDEKSTTSGSTSNTNTESKNGKSQPDGDNSGQLEQQTPFMYIQMEFCEKSTLRTAIDDNLYEDMNRAWRLFREIVEGLVHIHQQGMIHRDLKPVNIFLSLDDHVKIGDFGLATTNILKGGPETVVAWELPKSADFSDKSLTTNIGTALYVAPELLAKGTGPVKVIYNQKVDIYSLGIVFFEMVYHPLRTGMERVKAINGLRQKDITLPSDFDEISRPQESFIIRWLLNRDPSKRPSSLELLQSDYLPPPLMEEAELHEMFRKTLSNPQTKVYKHLIASCFRQIPTPAEELTYDMDVESITSNTSKQEFQLQSPSITSLLPLYQRLKDIVKCVFVKHGAIELNTPLLMPKSDVGPKTSSTDVHLMTHSGSIVKIPHDLRLPFARYVVSKFINNIKRYSIEKVYRERRVFGFHPRELIECAFDVVTSSQGTLVVDAESISVVFEILNELPWMKERNCMIRLGHTSLLDSILLHFSIDEKAHNEIRLILADLKTEKHGSKMQIQNKLVNLNLPDQFIPVLFNLMEIEGPLSKVSNFLKGVIKKNGIASPKAKEGLHELEVLINNIESFGIKSEVVVSPTMVFGVGIYSGLIYQVVSNVKRKKNKSSREVIAAGGRYDELLHKFRASRDSIPEFAVRNMRHYGVGVSISLDKLITGVDSNEIVSIGGNRSVDVILCALGHHSLAKEKILIMKELWSHGISCTSLENSHTQESAEEMYLELGASFIIILKDTEVYNTVRIRYIERDRFTEKKLGRTEIADFLLKNLRQTQEAASGEYQYGRLEVTKSISQNFEGQQQVPSSSSISSVNVNFVMSEGKERPANLKRRLENQILLQVQECISKYSKTCSIEIIASDIPSEVIKTMCSCIELTGESSQFYKGMNDVTEKHSRYKKVLKSIGEEIFDMYSRNKSPHIVILIYSINDNFYKCIM